MSLQLFVTLVATLAPDEAGTKQEMEKFQGTWSVASVEVDGKPIREKLRKQLTMTFAGNKYTLKIGDDVVVEGTFKLDPSKNPKTIDEAETSGPNKGSVSLGIYKWDGDDLTICFGANNDKNRPTKFSSERGTKHELVSLKRAKP